MKPPRTRAPCGLTRTAEIRNDSLPRGPAISRPAPLPKAAHFLSPAGITATAPRSRGPASRPRTPTRRLRKIATPAAGSGSRVRGRRGGNTSMAIAEADRTTSDGDPSGRRSRAVARIFQMRCSPSTCRRSVGIPSAATSPRLWKGAWARRCISWAMAPGEAPRVSSNAGLTAFASNGPCDPHTDRLSRSPPRGDKRSPLRHIVSVIQFRGHSGHQQ